MILESGRHSDFFLQRDDNDTGVRTFIERIYNDVHWSLSRISEYVL